MTSYGSGTSSPAATASTHPDLILLSSSPSSPSPSSPSSPSLYPSSPSSSPSSLTRCDICSYVKSSSRMFKTKRCSHPFCKRCVKKYVVTKIEEDSVAKINCPKPGCKRFIERGDCRGIIPKQVSDKWKDLLHDESEIHGQIGSDQMDERKQEKMVMELVEKKKWMRCPECKYYVEKTAGCDHIICWCKHEFCYRCGNRWQLIHNCIST